MANTKIKTKRKKIKNKLIFLLLPVVIVTILVLVGIATVLSGNSMTEMATAQLDSSISNQADNIEAWLDENLENFSSVKQVIEQTQPDEEGLQKILDSFYGFNKYCTEGPYVATADGRFYAASASGLKVTNPTGETFFKQGITSVNMNYGTAYTNDEGTSVISASGILNDGSGELKVIAADLSLDQISIIVNSGVKMDSAASFLIDASDNTILAHRDPERISTTLTTSDSDKLMAAIAEKLETRDYDTVALNGYEVAFREIQGTDWVLVSYIADSVILKDVMKLTNLLIIVGIVAVIVIVIMINLLVSKVIAPLGHITKNITDMSAGDFTIEVKQESDDEIGLMGSKVSEFVESMRTMLSTINEESEKLKE